MTCGTKRKIRESISDLLTVHKLMLVIRDDLKTALDEEFDTFRECFNSSCESREKEAALDRLGSLEDAIDDLSDIDLPEIAFFLQSIIE